MIQWCSLCCWLLTVHIHSSGVWQANAIDMLCSMCEREWLRSNTRDIEFECRQQNANHVEAHTIISLIMK